MKKLIAAIALTIFSAAIVQAAGPETMTFPTKMGTITFNHKKHQEMLKDCKACHAKGPGKIEGFGKDWGHQTCKGCHASKGQGPTKCAECHKR